MKQNEIEKLFDWYSIDEASEIAFNKVKNKIDRQLDYQHAKFLENKINPFIRRHREIISDELKNIH